MRFQLMDESKVNRFFPLAVMAALAVVILGPAGAATATPQMHFDGSGRETPWTNCTACHGSDLLGSIGPSCMSCHQPFSSPNPPPLGHHKPPGQWQHVLTEPRKDPAANGCATCHGANLTGGIGPSCFLCHDKLWGGGGPGNSPPNVVSGGPYTGVPNQPVQFDASGTTDPDGDTLTYFWLFGDGSPPQFPSQIPTTTHTYKNEGTYTAVLTVTDGNNTPVIVNVSVVISTSAPNFPPNVNPGGPYSGFAGQPVQFDASGTTDPEGDTLTYEWDFGDGSAPASAQVPTTSHTYAQPGTYLAVLTVTDGVNNPVSDMVDVEILQPNFPPNVDPGGPYSGVAGQPVQFDASGTTDPEGDTLTYEWDFGDGSSPEASQVPTTSHTYAQPGSYLAVLTVSDGVNDPVSDVVDVEITDSSIPPPEGGTWDVRLPFLSVQGTVTFEQFAGILWVTEKFADRPAIYGIGMRMDRFIFWMDGRGSLFVGTVDPTGSNMMGLVFNFMGRANSIWFAQQRSPNGGSLGLFGLGQLGLGTMLGGSRNP